MIEHPKLGKNADIAALNIEWGTDISRIPYYLKNDLDSVNLAIGPTEPLSVIGFPFGLSLSGKFPIWVTGTLAQELSHMTDENPSFLIDCRTRPGQSGSPVVAYRSSGYRFIDGSKIVSRLTTDDAWEFMGIYSGRINDEADLGIVWHVDAVRDLFNAAVTDYESRAHRDS